MARFKIDWQQFHLHNIFMMAELKVSSSISAFSAIVLLCGCSLTVGSRPEEHDADAVENDTVDAHEQEETTEDSGEDVREPERVDAQEIMDSQDNTEEVSACTAHLGGECNLVENCGCEGSNACRIVIDPEDTCSVVESCGPGGLTGVGDPCTSDMDCMPGTACLNDEIMGTRCRRWCMDVRDCPEGLECNIDVTFSAGTLGEGCAEVGLTPYEVCRLPCPSDYYCDPITGIPCSDPAHACLYDDYCIILYCGLPGTHAIGEDCSDGSGCVVGSQCMPTDGGDTRRCFEFCNTSHACPAGQSCSPVSPHYSSDPSLGYCR
jgi:hypothetical protein